MLGSKWCMLPVTFGKALFNSQWSQNSLVIRFASVCIPTNSQTDLHTDLPTDCIRDRPTDTDLTNQHTQTYPLTTDPQTDQPTDRPTHRPTHRLGLGPFRERCQKPVFSGVLGAAGFTGPPWCRMYFICFISPEMLTFLSGGIADRGFYLVHSGLLEKFVKNLFYMVCYVRPIRMYIYNIYIYICCT